MYDKIFLSKNNNTKREVIKEKTYFTTFTKIKTKDSIPQREKKKRKKRALRNNPTRMTDKEYP